MLRFGARIDLRKLDDIQPTKQVEEKRDEFKRKEREAEKRVEEYNQKLLLAKQKLLAEKKANTDVLTRITELGKQQMKLNKNLDSTNKQLFVAILFTIYFLTAFTLIQKEENEDKTTSLTKEKGHLYELVKFLSKEIEDLKTEIQLFKRKGKHQ